MYFICTFLRCFPRLTAFQTSAISLASSTNPALEIESGSCTVSGNAINSQFVLSFFSSLDICYRHTKNTYHHSHRYFLQAIFFWTTHLIYVSVQDIIIKRNLRTLSLVWIDIPFLADLRNLFHSLWHSQSSYYLSLFSPFLNPWLINHFTYGIVTCTFVFTSRIGSRPELLI